MPPVISIFGSSRATPDQPVYRDAMKLGRTLAGDGFVIANGGYGGLMEAVSLGAREVGGEVIGVTAPSVFPDRSGANDGITHEEPAESIAARIARVVDLADATVTLPGSLGTTAEFIVAWNTAFVAPMRGETPKLTIAVGPRWRRLVEHLEDGVGADSDFVSCVDSTAEAAELLRTHFQMPVTG